MSEYHRFEFRCPSCEYLNGIQVDANGAGTLKPEDHIIPHSPADTILKEKETICEKCHKIISFQPRTIHTYFPVTIGER